ncbi:hypothetical protein DPMN_057294 [Dreissena polymorpha]|uniref:Uncharacterized protein n=1 Tax=Dreissena polymorpha TaxID=45954 RepID=A0A9D4CW81_DREPO|nr:hypothetical protein DPMN_057294 [Dreissena polymorpha]
MARQRPTRAPQVEIDRIVIRDVQYQLEVNRCRNEEVMRGAPGLVCIVKIDGIVIRIVQYQLEVNRCNFGWVWPIWAGRLRIDRIVISEVQYQLEVNRCRNEEVILKCNFGWVWPMWVGRLRTNCIVIREFRGSNSGQDGQTVGRTDGRRR